MTLQNLLASLFVIFSFSFWILQENGGDQAALGPGDGACSFLGWSRGKEYLKEWFVRFQWLVILLFPLPSTSNKVVVTHTPKTNCLKLSPHHLSTAQLDQVYLLSLLTANGPTTAWFLFEAPTCGNLYQITPEIELNGGNPCEGGMLETDGCGEPLVGGTNLTTIVSLEEPYLVYLFRSEDVRRFDLLFRIFFLLYPNSFLSFSFLPVNAPLVLLMKLS